MRHVAILFLYIQGLTSTLVLVPLPPSSQHLLPWTPSRTTRKNRTEPAAQQKQRGHLLRCLEVGKEVHFSHLLIHDLVSLKMTEKRRLFACARDGLLPAWRPRLGRFAEIPVTVLVEALEEARRRLTHSFAKLRLQAAACPSLWRFQTHAYDICIRER